MIEVQPTPTIEEDARSYVNTLNSPANGWGQHVCRRTGYVSHWMLRMGNDRHGEINFHDAITVAFADSAKEIAS